MLQACRRLHAYPQTVPFRPQASHTQTQRRPCSWKHFICAILRAAFFSYLPRSDCAAIWLACKLASLSGLNSISRAGYLQTLLAGDCGFQHVPFESVSGETSAVCALRLAAGTCSIGKEERRNAGRTPSGNRPPNFLAGPGLIGP